MAPRLVVDRPAGDAAGPPGRSAPGRAARHGRRRGARDPPPPLRERARRRGLPRGAHDRGRTAARARARRGPSTAPPTVAGVDRPPSPRWPACTPRPSPAVIRCGWGLERNRNGGNAAAAILALPAVGGKFGVRGGGYTLSNSGSWGITKSWIGADGAAHAHRQHESPRAHADRAGRPAREGAVRLQLQSRWRRCRTRTSCARAWSATT